MASWRLTPEAKEYVLAKGGALRVAAPHTVDGCCIHFTSPPEVFPGPPKKGEEDRYQRIPADGVDLFLANCLVNLPPMTIGLNRFLGFRRLVVEGWKVV